ncbi:probable LRR receptor-like serine/threonine-protein kinase At1g05700 [Aristolochia californica]|uniref:probable LRR receptor-like serine/threonine-protein kinase At1g05700 n=1 Tax=Aristolochia californica TaxID=171875 RepID=UPI0035DF5A68
MVWVVLLLALFSRQAFSQDPYWLKIDCGGEDDSVTGWVSDDSFISTGHNSLPEEKIDMLQLNTLRFFSDQNKNCYTLPATAQEKYLIRAGFYYGNYDGKFRGPVFDLQFDGNFWVTVDTSNNTPFAEEAIVVAKRDNISVCVARTKDGDLPFISSLEMINLSPDMYGAMDNNTALFMDYRLNFGYSETVWWPDDPYARIWYPSEFANYINVIATGPINTLHDRPPSTVIMFAIEALRPLDPIELSFDLLRQERSKYVNLYFIDYSVSQGRSFDIYVDGENTNMTVSPTLEYSEEVYVVTEPTNTASLHLTLVPKADSPLPPIISAMELYTVSPDLVQGTNDNDVSGLGLFAYNSEKLRSWTGDPCLPSNTVWEWLRCSQKDPPRVTALYLAGHGLQGPLHDFSQMDALEIIDLHNNSLSGPIPDFLGRLPNLKELNLAENNFDGKIPESLTNNKKISLNVTSNPSLGHSDKNKTPLIVGLSVGGAFLFVVICILLAVLIYKCRKPAKTDTEEELGEAEAAAQAAPARVETVVLNGEDPTEEVHTGLESEEDSVPVNLEEDDEISAGLRRQMESEFEDLLEQHGQQAGNAESHRTV